MLELRGGVALRLDDFEMWLFSQSYAPATIRQRVSLLRLMEADGLDIDTTEDLDISRYLYNKDELGYGAKNNRVKAINLYLKFLGRDFRLKHVKRFGAKEFWIPTPEEKERLLNVELGTKYQTWRARLIMKILFEAGIRAAELCGLKMDDVKRKVIRKDGKEFVFWYLDVVGKGSKRRQVPISKGLVDDIREYYRYHGRDPWIFGIKPAMLRNITHEIGKAAEVRKFHPHAARHYRAVELYQNGVPLEAIREFLGHSSLATTQIYLQGSKGFVFFEISKLQEVKHGKTN